jgi:hypothetical protein
MARRTCSLSTADSTFSTHSLSGSSTSGRRDFPKTSALASHVAALPGVEEDGDDQEALLWIDRQQTTQGFRVNVKVFVTKAGLEAEYQARARCPDGPSATAAAIRTSLAGSAIASSSCVDFFQRH